MKKRAETLSVYEGLTAETPPFLPAEEVFEFAREGDVDGLRHAVRSLPRALREKDYNGNTPLHLAAQCDRYEAVEWLLSECLRQERSWQMANRDGGSPWHVACMAGHVRLLPLFLGAGCAIDDKSADGTALWEIASMNVETGTAEPQRLLDVARWLLNHGADANACGRKFRRSVLMQAVRQNNTHLVDVLLEKNVNLGWCDEAGQNALAYAAINGRVSMTERMLRTVADDERWALMSHRNQYGQTPLALAAKNFHETTVRTLLHYEKNVEQAWLDAGEPSFMAECFREEHQRRESVALRETSVHGLTQHQHVPGPRL